MRSRASMRRGDQINRWLVLGIFFTVVLILTAILWIVVTGLMNPPAPRSYHEKQLDLLGLVVQQKPNVPAAWADYARAYMAAKQYSRAKRVLDRGEKIVGKDTPELAVERARLAVYLGKTDEALKLLEHAIKVTEAKRKKVILDMASKGITPDPRIVNKAEMADAAEMQGDLFSSKKKWAEAVKAYSAALYEDPQAADVLVKRGAVYLEMDKTAKAKADFGQALKYVPDFEPALKGLSRIEKGSDQ